MSAPRGAARTRVATAATACLDDDIRLAGDTGIDMEGMTSAMRNWRSDFPAAAVGRPDGRASKSSERRRYQPMPKTSSIRRVDFSKAIIRAGRGIMNTLNAPAAARARNCRDEEPLAKPSRDDCRLIQKIKTIAHISSYFCKKSAAPRHFTSRFRIN